MLVYTGVTRGANAWLSVTPEPERLLPDAVATLEAGGSPPTGAVERERALVARAVLRRRLAAWLAYLHRALELAERRAGSADPQVARARELAMDVIANHHHLLLGLPGSAARLTASERARLTRGGPA
jgi:hypothetical protein